MESSLKICTSCGQKLTMDLFVLAKGRKDGRGSWCRKCMSMHARNLRHGIKRPKTYNMVNRGRRTKAENGVDIRKCGACGLWKPLLEGFSRNGRNNRDYYCRTCRNAERRAIQQRERQAVLDEYGGKCACCSESYQGFLTIDHINNDGKEHRKTVPAAHLYRWLRKNEYPKDNFQILCYNCNYGKAANGGICPHKTESGSPES